MPARTLVLTSIMMLSFHMAVGQLCFPVKKAYAYFQPVTRGIASREEAKNRRQPVNHLVYLVSKSEGVKVNNVWINGELYAAELKEVTTPVSISTPVTHSPAGGKEHTILVPSTSRKAYQLLFTALKQTDLKPSIPKKFINVPVLLELQYRNKKKFVAVEEVKQLEVMPLQ